MLVLVPLEFVLWLSHWEVAAVPEAFLLRCLRGQDTLLDAGNEYQSCAAFGLPNVSGL